MLNANSGPAASLPWHSRLVRDLAWAIGSPPLVCPDDRSALWPDADWYRQQLAGFADELQALEADARARALAMPARRDQRLGAYFEALLALWLQRDPRYELLARNLAIRQPRRGGGRETLGELDMLVMNHARERVEHWEVAVKFYLGRLQTGAEGEPAEWVGPGLKDRLDSKVSRLLEHQLRLPGHARARAVLAERGLKIDDSRVIMKGRLFYPLDEPPDPPDVAAPEHIRGWWLRVGEFPQHFAGKNWSWRRLSRREWLAPVADLAGTTPVFEDAMSFAGSDEVRAANWPRMVVALADGREVTRGFLVPDGWEIQQGPCGDSGSRPDPEQAGTRR